MFASIGEQGTVRLGAVAPGISAALLATVVGLLVAVPSLFAYNWIAARIRHALPQGFALVDLGAGNCAKAARLFASLAPTQYVAVDISVEFMRDAVLSLQRQHPATPMTAGMPRMASESYVQMPTPEVSGCGPTSAQGL